MIAMQILLFKTISNKVIQTKLFNKMFGKHFDRAAKKGYLAIVKGRDRLKTYLKISSTSQWKA